MKVILLGATGMVGQGALLECFDDPEVEEVLAIVRRPTGRNHVKLHELIHDDFTNFASVGERLSGYDACLYCLGVSAAGLREDAYRRITYDYALELARVLASKNPKMTFCFVSGAGTDATERGRFMWARVKGQTENALSRLSFAAVYHFRPGFIQPMRGVVSKTPLYRAFYGALGPLHPMLKTMFPNLVTTSEVLGRAMLRVARHGYRQPVLENKAINEVGESDEPAQRAPLSHAGPDRT